MTPMTFNVDIDPAYERMANADRRFRYVALLCAFTLGLFIIATCACTPAPRIPSSGPGRDAVAQMKATVMVEVGCMATSPFGKVPPSFEMPNVRGGVGSGTALGNHHILTAQHVIDCPVARTIQVVTYDGRVFKATVDREDADADVARLEVSDSLALDVPPVIINYPTANDRVCAFSAYPVRGSSCGDLVTVEHMSKGNLLHTARVEHGNSGGGLYTGGYLTGVTTHLIPCDISDMFSTTPVPGCGGRATTLFGRHDEWFKGTL